MKVEMAMGYGLLAIGLLLVPSAEAQRPASPPTPESRLLTPETGEELTVTLVTYETGGLMWERFGHNAIWIHNNRTGADDHYDYGRFSFERPHFVLRFIEGKMWYSMGYENNVPGMIALYARQGRKIWAQELDLTPSQRLALQEFLVWNWRPENREYFYDYYRDNCSTRIRDAIDKVVGGAIRQYGSQPSGLTWRDETRRLNENRIPLYTGMLLVLGHPVDAEMTRWEQMFLPMRLRQHLDSVIVAGSDGSRHPLVRGERMLSAGGRWPVPDRPSSWLLWYLIVGMLFGGLLAALGPTRLFMPLATLWALLIGLTGLFMTYIWSFSHHVAGYRNENLFLCNVLALGLAVVLPAASRGRKWAVPSARRLALLVAALGVLGFALKVSPWFRQHNLEIIALVLPVHLGLWWGLERNLWGRTG